MSYEEKLASLQAVVGSCVTFSSAQQAKEYRDSWRQPVTSPVSQDVQRLAEDLYLQLTTGGCGELEKIGRCEGARLSALREAIRACAGDYLARTRELTLA